MDALLESLEPKAIWSYFLELSKIPRGSKQEQAAAKWVLDQAKAMGLDAQQDAIGNVIVRKPATPGREKAPITVLQAHVDMVCEKNEGTQHDFLKDPIRVVRDGDVLRASGTTLGADNGIGVAAAMAVMAAKDIAHGPLEFLITIDEETGLTGAGNLQPGLLKGKYFLNLDSEEEGDLTIGCAGGMDTVATKTMKLVAPAPGSKAYRVKVLGLKGGHSGMEIHQGRGNALRILGQILFRVVPAFDLQVASFTGGNKRNAIPREASATVFLNPAKEPALKAALATLQKEIQDELGAFDPTLALDLSPASEAPAQAFAADDADAVTDFLFGMVHGVVAMSPDIPGLVQSSTNLAMIATQGNQVEVCLSHRSSVESAKYAVADRVQAICRLAGFTTKRGDGYPGWKPEPNASLVKVVNGVHAKVFGKAMGIKAIHAGLECGLIGEKYPAMEMVSFGPDMWDVHTPDEHVSIPSVGNFWKLLVAVLEAV
ncbi:aminoacyl-histidine dipeptidase [Geothrix oryzae]|uniref:Aminoacyl-histidine dipeptidase n=1 Tax=Geothrix oryzae TaxID=2927975 RepID=A0ABM8DSC5_9BACT|nr:aminoacyl-histidine dipeptidase [Geothrix oryzae]BDU69915.1 aminoacyl-histidine dipeptidase [Geothrix oryzae]